MKRLKILYCILTSFLLVSCSEDFLDLADPTKVTSGNFYTTRDQFEQAVNGVYSQLQAVINNQWVSNELPSDNTTFQISPSNRFYGDRHEAIDVWAYTQATANFAQFYNAPYSALYNANFALNELEGADIDQAAKNQFEGELKFMRAYLYFQLVQQFGPVILLTEPVASPKEAYESTRAPVEEVWTQIIADLVDASSLLPRKEEYPGKDKGRATKGSALGLLGKCYLTVKDYPKAESALREVTTLGYALLDSYEDVFDPANKNHNESLFEIQFKGGDNLGEHSEFIFSWLPWNGAEPLLGYTTVIPLGLNIPTNDMIHAFEEGDLRKDVALKEGFYIGEAWEPVPYINKFLHPHEIPGRSDENWPVLRYSDVLLMLAEAINEQGAPTDEAYSCLNAVRQRADLDPLSGLNQSSFREAVLKERRVELCFENHRWFDLKRTMSPSEMVSFLNAHGSEERANPTAERFNIPFAEGDYVIEEYQLLFPIPELQMDLGRGLEQNLGYD